MQQTRKNSVYRQVTLICTLSLGAAAFSLSAQEAEKKGWETTAAAGLTLTRGNSDTFLGTVSLDTSRKWTNDEARLGVSGAYGEANSVRNQKSVNGYGQYNRLFNARLYGGLRVDGLYDEIAGIDYRFKVSPLLGYYLIKEEKTSLSLETGPSVIFERLRGTDQKTYAAIRFGERFEHKLTDTTKLWQTLEYLPQLDRWTEKYLLIGEVGIDAAITKKVSLRAVFQDMFDNLPAPGRKKNDMRLIVGIAYKF